MQQKYPLYRRSNGGFYWQENGSQKQGSLRTKDKREAQSLLNAMNETHRQPTVNLALGRAYLAPTIIIAAERTEAPTAKIEPLR